MNSIFWKIFVIIHLIIDKGMRFKLSFGLNVRNIFYNIWVPHNTIMDLNNVMRVFKHEIYKIKWVITTNHLVPWSPPCYLLKVFFVYIMSSLSLTILKKIISHQASFQDSIWSTKNLPRFCCIWVTLIVMFILDFKILFCITRNQNSYPI